jgi:hypothetical protein
VYWRYVEDSAGAAQMCALRDAFVGYVMGWEGDSLQMIYGVCHAEAIYRENFERAGVLVASRRRAGNSVGASRQMK